MAELLQTSLPMPRATIHDVTDFIAGGHLNPFMCLSLEFLKESTKG